MKYPLVALALGAFLAPAMAQDCLSTPYGTSLGVVSFDYEYPIQSIGFAFPFGGSTYTDIHITTKGMCYLSNAGIPVSSGPDYSPTVAELLSGPPRLCPMWTDMGADVSVGSDVFLDSSPTRCVVTWSDCVSFGTSGPTFTVQMQLFPGGEMKFFYSSSATNGSTWSSTPPGYTCYVGASPGGGATQPTPVDYSSGAVISPLATIYEEWPVANTFDLAGAVYVLTPTSPGWVAVPGGTVGCATAVDYGQGCGERADSFYELQSMGSFDLQNSTVTWLRTGTGYVVFGGVPGTIVPPTAAAQTVATGQLDGEQGFALSTPMPVPGGTTSLLQVCTKGYIGTAAGNPIDYTPDGAQLVAFPATTFACWHDYNQTAAGSGIITFEEIGGIAYATWNGVYSFGTTAPNTCQFQFDLATGNVTLVMGAFSGSATQGDIVVGYSSGLTVRDPGAQDLSTQLPLTLQVEDVGLTGLSLTTNGVPRLGNATFRYEVDGIQALVPLAFLFLGDTQIPPPGVDLTFLGMAGCQAYTNANLGSATLSATGPTASFLLAIPNNPALTGLQFSAQALAFSLATSLNLVSSNGTMVQIGL